jgi:hypothetical protein
MACRAIRDEWIKFRNTSQNEGLDSKKYSVSFQTDGMDDGGIVYRDGGQHG